MSPMFLKKGPLKIFLSILKGTGYKNGWTAKNLNKMDKNIAQDLMRSTLSRIDKVRRNGVTESK